jgi:hypothetical protein
MRWKNWWWSVMVLFTAANLGGCARTTVQPEYERTASGPALRPSRVLVYDFTVSAASVSENQGIIAGAVNALRGTTESEREMVIAREVQDSMAEELVAGIRELGLPAERAKEGAVVPADAIAVAGEFLNVDEGNRLRRAVIGFGAGQSQVATQVHLYAPSNGRLARLLEFSTQADSGSAPGALVTGGAGAAAQGGMTAGRAAVNMGVGAAKGRRSQVEQITTRSADQAVAYLSEFFARQGWIPQEKVRQAKQGNQ